MKLKVTEEGVSQNGKVIAVGEVITVDGDTVPASLTNKVAIINPENGGEPKTYEQMSRAELDALAADRAIDIKDAKNKPDVIAALQLADEAAK